PGSTSSGAGAPPTGCRRLTARPEPGPSTTRCASRRAPVLQSPLIARPSRGLDMRRLGTLLRKIVGRYYRISCAWLGRELGQDGGGGGDGVDAEDAGDLHHLEDLLRRGAVPDRVLDVQLQPLDVQVSGRGVERDVDELLDLGLEGAV